MIVLADSFNQEAKEERRITWDTALPLPLLGRPVHLLYFQHRISFSCIYKTRSISRFLLTTRHETHTLSSEESPENKATNISMIPANREKGRGLELESKYITFNPLPKKTVYAHDVNVNFLKIKQQADQRYRWTERVAAARAGIEMHMPHFFLLF